MCSLFPGEKATLVSIGRKGSRRRSQGIGSLEGFCGPISEPRKEILSSLSYLHVCPNTCQGPVLRWNCSGNQPVFRTLRYPK